MVIFAVPLVLSKSMLIQRKSCLFLQVRRPSSSQKIPQSLLLVHLTHYLWVTIVVINVPHNGTALFAFDVGVSNT